MNCATCGKDRLRVAGLAAVCVLGLIAAPVIGKEADNTTAERLVEEARQAQIDGNAARSFALLREAVRVAPDYELARWRLGQVHVDGEWLAVEEAQRRAAADPKQATYWRLRAEHGDSPEGQLALARWCRSNDLDDESRFHWASVLAVDSNHREALRALNIYWHDGRLLTRDQIKQTKQEAIDTRRVLRQWSAGVAAWERALCRKRDTVATEVVDEIRAIRDVGAIPAFERVTLVADEIEKTQQEARCQLSLAFVDALDAMSDDAAAGSLVRHAVLSTFTEVRNKAIDRLGERPLHDVVPLLLDGLTARIESSFRVVVDNDGSIHYLHSMYREGPLADWSHRVSHSVHQQASPERIAARLTGDTNRSTVEAAMAEARAAALATAVAQRSARRYEQEAMAAEQEVAQANEKATALNERIVAVLTRVTDQELGTEPRAWWDWWQKYNEYDESEDRPVYETEDVTSEYIIPETRKECFAAGTLVWTKTGQRPIESLQLGDLVLAQNVESGELRYQPVIGRTVRPPTPILKFSWRGEALRASRGHPFWVVGIGWRMAKELGDGAILYGVTGSPRVEAIELDGEEEAYNLVVADFNTYFVGESGILVHDNTPRRPTRATLPGMAAK
jgi:hypothetical protein